MTIKRRKKIGATLLVAGAGVTVSMVNACVGTSGNLMAPPLVQLCIDVEPETATVTLSDSYMYEDTAYTGGTDSLAITNGECTHVDEYSSVTISATADGYQDYSEEIVVEGKTTHAIEMTVEETTAEE